MLTPTATAAIIGTHAETVRRTVTPEQATDGITVSSTYRTSLTGGTRICCYSCAVEIGRFYAASYQRVDTFRVREIDPDGRMRRRGWTVPTVERAPGQPPRTFTRRAATGVTA